MITDIPCHHLISIPKYIPGTLRDQTGLSLLSRQIVIICWKDRKKADALPSIIRQFDDKNGPSSIVSSSKSTDNKDFLPNDFLCHLDKRVSEDEEVEQARQPTVNEENSPKSLTNEINAENLNETITENE